MTTTYAIRVDGHLDDHWSDWFGGLTITRNSDGTWGAPGIPGRGSDMIFVWSGDEHGTAEAGLFAGVDILGFAQVNGHASIVCLDPGHRQTGSPPSCDGPRWDGPGGDGRCATRTSP